MKDDRKLRGFSASRGAFHNDDAMGLKGGKDSFFLLVNREVMGIHTGIVGEESALWIEAPAAAGWIRGCRVMPQVQLAVRQRA
jgi:hypothetical protein